MKIPVVVCNATYAKISCADFTGIGMIEPPREGPLNRAKVLISGIVKHALTGTMPLPLEQRAGTGLMLRLNSAEWQPTATCVTLR